MGSIVQPDLSLVLPDHPGRDRDASRGALAARHCGLCRRDRPNNGEFHAQADPDRRGVANRDASLCRRLAEFEPRGDQPNPAGGRAASDDGNGRAADHAAPGGCTAGECSDGDDRTRFNYGDSAGRNGRPDYRRAGYPHRRNNQAEAPSTVHRGPRDPRTASAWDLLVRGHSSRRPHCERSETIEKCIRGGILDCSVARAPRNDGERAEAQIPKYLCCKSGSAISSSDVPLHIVLPRSMI